MDCHRRRTIAAQPGAVIYSGTAESDTGIPGEVHSQTNLRVLRAPVEGYVQSHAVIGDLIEAGQPIAMVGGQAVIAPFKGMLRGLIHERVRVTAGMKIGDLDPRARREHCFTISDKSLAVGGGVLEAILAASQIRPYLLAQAEHETSQGA
jgi:xanthine dehydrogenase accessory factor